MTNWGVFRKIGRQISAAGLLLALLGCSGMSASTPRVGDLAGGPAGPMAQQPAQGDTPILAAAGPTQEGILSAPADDDNVQSDGKVKIVHFEAFLPKDYQTPLSTTDALFPLKDLKLLVKVGEATKEGCVGMADPTCWKWLDPNLLKGVVVRAKVFTEIKNSLPDNPGVFLKSPGWYYQDFKISELQPEGYNLSLVELGAVDKDRIELTLFNAVPDDYSPTRSPIFQGYPEAWKGKGQHNLGVIEVGELFMYPPPTNANGLTQI